MLPWVATPVLLPSSDLGRPACWHVHMMHVATTDGSSIVRSADAAPAPEQAATGARPSDGALAARLGLERPELVPALARAGAEARALLYASNVRLAYKLAARFRGKAVPMEDLIEVRLIWPLSLA